MAAGTRVAHLYGVECLAEVRATAAPLLLGEGESDRWTAAHYGLYFIGVPGKSLWAGERGRRWAGQLAGLDVFIWQEPGAEDFTARIAADLPGARLIVASEGIKDLSEAHLQGRDVLMLVKKLRAVAPLAADTLRSLPEAGPTAVLGGGLSALAWRMIEELPDCPDAPRWKLPESV